MFEFAQFLQIYKFYSVSKFNEIILFGQYGTAKKFNSFTI